MTNLPGPTDPSSPETAPVRPVEPRSPAVGPRTASDALSGPQTDAGGSEAPQTDTGAESPADTTQGRQTGAESPRRGTDGCQAEAVLRAQVRAALRNAGLSQAEAARQLDVSTKHMCQMLTDRAPLTLGWAERILALCGQRIVIDVEPGGEPDAPGWCPSCGRGDVAPTGEQLAQAQWEAEQARAQVDDMANATAQLATGARRRAELAEAEAGRLRAALERITDIPRLPHASQQDGELGRAYTRGWQSVVSAVDTALAGRPVDPEADAYPAVDSDPQPDGAVEHVAGPDEPGDVDTDGPQR